MYPPSQQKQGCDCPLFTRCFRFPGQRHYHPCCVVSFYFPPPWKSHEKLGKGLSTTAEPHTVARQNTQKAMFWGERKMFWTWNVCPKLLNFDQKNRRMSIAQWRQRRPRFTQKS